MEATGTCNLYVAHDGAVDFVSQLDAARASGERDAGDAVDWAAGNGPSDVFKEESEKSARVSENGEVLVFRSQRRLTSYDNHGPTCGEFSRERIPGECLEFYRFDYGSASLTCLTCDTRGATPVGPARLASVRSPNIKAPWPAATLGRNLSRDGARFFFETPDALVAADTNGQEGCPPWGSNAQQGSSYACQDVYEWEAPESGSCRESSPAYSPPNGGCIYLISTGKSEQASFFADADPDGSNVFVFTYEQLVGQDKDHLLDVYDARLGGGLASQQGAEGTPCEGESCKPQPLPSPATQSPGSASFAGPGNPPPARAHKKKHKHRKHAKRHKGKHGAEPGQGKKSTSRTAKTNGRAGR